MTNKEILIDLLKRSLGDRLLKLEKKNNEEESSLKLIKTSYDGFKKRITDLNKLREQKIAKDKLEEQKKLAAKKAEEARKAKKKEAPSKTGRKSNVNALAIKKNIDKMTDKKGTFQKTKSTAHLNKKPLTRGKSVSRLQTINTEISRNTTRINSIRRKTITNKKEGPATEAPRRNTISEKKF